MSVVAAAGIVACSDPTSGDTAAGLAFTEYSESGGRTLKQFLDAWHAEVQPVTPAELATKSAAVQAGYKLFEDYWNPLDISRYSTGIENSPHYSLYDDHEFLVVQGSVRYRTGGCGPYDDRCGPYIDVNDFRPMVLVPGKKILYQTAEHTGPIERYIDAGTTDREIEARTDFVGAIIGVNFISCRTCWIFSSAPLVRTIDFNPDLTRAEVYFWVGNLTGKSTLEKVNGTWRITASHYTGILD